MPRVSDKELDNLLERLNAIHDEVKPADKEGKKKKKKKKGDAFNETEARCKQSIREAERMIEADSGSKAGGNNPTEVIKLKHNIRKKLQDAEQAVTELSALYSAQARKRLSKLSDEELQLRGEKVGVLRAHIDMLRTSSARVGGGGGGRSGGASAFANTNFTSIDDAPIFGPGGGGGGGGGPSTSGAGDVEMKTEDMSGEQQSQLQSVWQRDKEQDLIIEQIHQGVLNIAELTMAQQEQLKLQSIEIDGLNSKMDGVTEHIGSVNSKLKKTLDEVRKSDMICVDVICLLLSLGLIMILIQILNDTNNMENPGNVDDSGAGAANARRRLATLVPESVSGWFGAPADEHSVSG